MEEGSTIGGRGGPNIWIGGRGVTLEVTGVDWRTGEAECWLEAALASTSGTRSERQEGPDIPHI